MGARISDDKREEEKICHLLLWHFGLMSAAVTSSCLECRQRLMISEWRGKLRRIFFERGLIFPHIWDLATDNAQSLQFAILHDLDQLWPRRQFCCDQSAFSLDASMSFLRFDNSLPFNFGLLLTTWLLLTQGQFYCAIAFWCCRCHVLCDIKLLW